MVTREAFQEAFDRLFVDGAIPAHIARRGYALATEDDMGKVLRIHLLIERALKNGIAQSVPWPDHLPRLRSFGDRVGLALALGLDPDLKGPLTAINSLRNDFAHEENKERVTDEDVRRLRSAMIPNHARIAEEMHELSAKMARDFGLEIEHMRPISELTPGNRWAFYALAVLSGLEFREWGLALPGKA
ncbi:hypothetical protein [Hydrocarboniphaga effusa]|uniref:hypothetical protein n=1 Tax=Hydrocarboniphaga effusa TaxID=243629 RepID=UPI003BA9A63C